MARRMALTMVLFAGCVWCLVLATRAESGEPAPPPPFKPVAAADAVMTGQGLVFKELKNAVTVSKSPKRPKEIAHLSEALAELSNVNIYHAKKDDYQKWATQLRDIALELAAEAEKKPAPDETKLKTLLSNLEKTCNSCHDVYQK